MIFPRNWKRDPRFPELKFRSGSSPIIHLIAFILFSDGMVSGANIFFRSRSLWNPMTHGRRSSSSTRPTSSATENIIRRSSPMPFMIFHGRPSIRMLSSRKSFIIPVFSCLLSSLWEKSWKKRVLSEQFKQGPIRSGHSCSQAWARRWLMRRKIILTVLIESLVNTEVSIGH